MSFLLTHCCSVEYWEKFGGQYVAMLEAMNPQPDEVILSSLVPLDVPPCIRNIITKELFWDGVNEAVEASSCDWVIPVGVDQIMLPDALVGLDRDCDVISIAGRTQHGQICQADSDGYEQILTSTTNPMKGMPVLRREVHLAYPARRSMYSDWIQWMEFRKAGIWVEFDTTQRFIHWRHPEAVSFQPHPQGEADVALFRTFVNHYEIIPGQEFPPVAVKEKRCGS
jgi:hypothetical protein